VPGNDYNAAFVHVAVRHFCWKCLHLMMDCSTRSVGFWGIREVSSTGWLLKYTPCTFYHLLLHTILFCAQLQLMAITGAKKGGMCCCLLDWAWIPVIAGFGMQGQSRNAEHILSEASMLPGKRGTGSAACSLLDNFHNCTLSTGLPQSVLGCRMSSPLSQVQALSRRQIRPGSGLPQLQCGASSAIHCFPCCHQAPAAGGALMVCCGCCCLTAVWWILQQAHMQAFSVIRKGDATSTCYRFCFQCCKLVPLLLFRGTLRCAAVLLQTDDLDPKQQRASFQLTTLQLH
jgi:hypothetical protein